MNRLSVVLFLFGLLASSCNALDGEGIRGGDPAAPGEFPYQISLEIMGQSICGGGIIDDHWVVTAGHCIVNELTTRKRFPMTVVAGLQDLRRSSSKRVERAVDRAFVPKRYLSNVEGKHVVGDIALLKLKQPFDLATNTHLSKLQLPQQKSYAHEKATISGYGWTWVEVEVDEFTGQVKENGDTNGKMRYAETTILTNAECTKKYFSVVPATSICAQVIQKRPNDPEGVCSGDSGGPLVHNGKTLIGVVSSSPLGCMEHIRPGIYTRVSSYVDFIHKIMKGNVDSTILNLKFP